jgi:hypothetical protein
MNEQCLGQNRAKAFARWLGLAAEASPRRQGSAHEGRGARGHRAPATRGGAAGGGLPVAPVG